MSDYISIQKAIEKITERALETFSLDAGYEHYLNALQDVANDLMQMPTVEAVPVKHGEWVSDRLVTTSGGTYGVRRCSLCEAYYQDVGYGWNYCPNCGAKMDGERKDDGMDR